MPLHLFDSSRPPNAKERKAFATRLGRLEGNYGRMVESAAEHINSRLSGIGPLGQRGFRLRELFCYLEVPPVGNFSDRKVPSRQYRPPATRISSSRGSTLRLYLLALALTQMEKTAGGTGIFLPVAGDTKNEGWTDFVVTDAGDNTGENFIASKDKRTRSVRSSLKALEGAQLLSFVAATGKRGSFARYHWLDESGSQSGSSELYKVPRPQESLITLPRGFILNSWVNVLEDSEITLLLMIACGKGGFRDEGYVALPSDVRLLHYGIARDPYLLARKTLEQFGLIEVVEIGRHTDGRAEGENGHLLHRFRIREEGFEKEALSTACETLKQQLSRV